MEEEVLEESLRIAGFVIAPRALFVAIIYFLSLQMLNVHLGKTLVISSALYVMMRLPLGRRHIDRFAFLVFFIAALYWIEVMPLRKWTGLTIRALEARLVSTLKPDDFCLPKSTSLPTSSR